MIPSLKLRKIKNKKCEYLSIKISINERGRKKRQLDNTQNAS